jgi:hypothetical protein
MMNTSGLTKAKGVTKGKRAKGESYQDTLVKHLTTPAVLPIRIRKYLLAKAIERVIPEEVTRGWTPRHRLVLEVILQAVRDIDSQYEKKSPCPWNGDLNVYCEHLHLDPGQIKQMVKAAGLYKTDAMS